MPNIGFKHSEKSRVKMRKSRKGIWSRFVNPMLGKKGIYKHTKETKDRMRKNKLNNKNPNWLGNKVGYAGIHTWVRRRLKKLNRCTVCKKLTNKLDLANISQKYKRNLSDWEWLCRKCHMTKDGRLKKFKGGKELYPVGQIILRKGYLNKKIKWIKIKSPNKWIPYHCLKSKDQNLEGRI